LLEQKKQNQIIMNCITLQTEFEINICLP